ncbi:hypothetical protein GF354_04205, partial [Candidatus Peregrinibacteria bacterium]|nr:hypothetical protein [Candidatus Peregrinibacteria bacterium]
DCDCAEDCGCDSDGDGTPNEDDPDADGDGISNANDDDDDNDGTADGRDPTPGGFGTSLGDWPSTWGGNCSSCCDEDDDDCDGTSNDEDLDMDGDGDLNGLDDDTDGDGDDNYCDNDDDNDGTPDVQDTTPLGYGCEVSGEFKKNSNYGPWHIRDYMFTTEPEIRLRPGYRDFATVNCDIVTVFSNYFTTLMDSGDCYDSHITYYNNNFTSSIILDYEYTESLSASRRYKLHLKYGDSSDGLSDLNLDEIDVLALEQNRVDIGVYVIKWYVNENGNMVLQDAPSSILSDSHEPIEVCQDDYWGPGANIDFRVVESKVITIPSSYDFTDTQYSWGAAKINRFTFSDHEQEIRTQVYNASSYTDSEIGVRVIYLPGEIFYNYDNDYIEGYQRGKFAYVIRGSYTNLPNNVARIFVAHEIGHVMGCGHDQASNDRVMYKGNAAANAYYIESAHALVVNSY